MFSLCDPDLVSTCVSRRLRAAGRLLDLVVVPGLGHGQAMEPRWVGGGLVVVVKTYQVPALLTFVFTPDLRSFMSMLRSSRRSSRSISSTNTRRKKESDTATNNFQPFSNWHLILY